MQRNTENLLERSRVSRWQHSFQVTSVEKSGGGDEDDEDEDERRRTRRNGVKKKVRENEGERN